MWTLLFSVLAVMLALVVLASLVFLSLIRENYVQRQDEFTFLRSGVDRRLDLLTESVAEHEQQLATLRSEEPSNM